MQDAAKAVTRMHEPDDDDEDDDEDEGFGGGRRRRRHGGGDEDEEEEGLGGAAYYDSQPSEEEEEEDEYDEALDTKHPKQKKRGGATADKDYVYADVGLTPAMLASRGQGVEMVGAEGDEGYHNEEGYAESSVGGGGYDNDRTRVSEMRDPILPPQQQHGSYASAVSSFQPPQQQAVAQPEDDGAVVLQKPGI